MSLFECTPDQAIGYEELTKKLSVITRSGDLKSEIAKTFYLFQLTPNDPNTLIQSLHKTEPIFEGTEEKPDILLHTI